MLSNASRLLTYLNAVMYAILGAFLFIMPETLALVFAWKVTAFITMTIGGWCLGNAWLAYFTSRRWHWTQTQPSLIYLWIFGILELLVVFSFSTRLQLGHPIAMLYLGTLLMNAVAAFVGILDHVRRRPAVDRSGSQTTSLQYTLLILFILFVGFLGIYASTAQIGDIGTNGGIFPEVMTLFTLRSFGAFYLSISLCAVPLLWNRNLQTFLSLGFHSYGLIIFITLAAFVYFRLFDFAQRPGGLLYFAAYLSVGTFFFIQFRRHGTGHPRK